MGPLFGMAGIAEAAFAEAAGMLCIGVVVVFAAALVVLLYRTRLAAVLGVAVWALLAMRLEPWRGFWPEHSDDPDLQSFLEAFQQLAWWWVAATSGLALAVVRAFWPRKREDAPAQPRRADP
jgi:hypothetical protein